MLDTIKNSVQTLLVPLDGSQMAESVLPATLLLASRFRAHVILLHIREQSPPATIHGERHLSGDIQEAHDYLAQVADRFRKMNIAVEIHVHEPLEGDVAQSIVSHANEYSPDMVILCTHGSGGLTGLVSGPIAQQVLHQGNWPILLMHPREDNSTIPFDPRNILVPLDLEHEHGTALSGASAIACAFNARIHLLVVVPTSDTLSGKRAATGTLLPTVTRAILDIAEQEGREHLARVADVVRCGEALVDSQVVRGEPVTRVLQIADEINADIIVLTSHGRSGLDAFFSGSIGPRIASRSNRTILLVKDTQ